MAKTTITLKGVDALRGKFADIIEGTRDKVAEAKEDIITTATTALLDAIPVWSGRTVNSLVIAETGSKVATAAAHPIRHDKNPEGKYHAVEAYGMTSKMALGAEPMRRAAMTAALIELGNLARLKDAKSVTISVASVVGDAIAAGEAPTPATARNKSVAPILRTVLAKVRAKHGNKLT